MHVVADIGYPITCVYDRSEEAVRVVNELKAAGVPPYDISFVSGGKSHGTVVSTENHDPDTTSTGAGTAATLGIALGAAAGLLVSVGAIAIPGAGPFVAAGWLMATLTGVGVGAAAGGSLGLLTGAGVDDTDTRAHADHIERGGTLVTVRAQNTTAARVEQIMRSPPAWLGLFLP